MSGRTKLGLGLVLVIVLGGGIAALTAAKRGGKAVEVRLEKVAARDLVAAVTASGKIDPKTSVDISADITGRITRIAVREGDLVRKGQFLLQIDPAQYQANLARAEALLASSQATLVQTKANRDQAERAQQRSLEIQKINAALISAEAVEQAQTALEVAEANYSSARASVEQARAGVAEARDNLRKTTLVSPISGRVVRLPVEAGEVAVPSTFSKDVGLLMTIADLSVILAKVQVDETDVVRLKMGDSVQVTIDAFPDTSFLGRVSKISNSAQLTTSTSQSGANDRAVDFDVEVTLTNPPPDIRPDLSCTARIVTDTRTHVLSVPIIALTVRENEPVANESVPRDRDTTKRTGKAKETEGVFVVRDGVATFLPVKVGIAGDEYFEVLQGLREGETIVAGSYQAIRDLKDGAKVKEAKEPKDGTKPAEKKS